MRVLTVFIVAFQLFFILTPVAAEPAAEWLRRWNAEQGRESELKEEDVLIKTAEVPLFEGMQVAGFRQTDGTFPLGRVMWKGEAYTPLGGMGKVLSDVEFSSMTDEEREATFLSLLQQTFGLLGARVYTGKPMSDRGKPRPEPIKSMRNVDDSHRFQVWFYEFPVKADEGEWREVLYVVSADGQSVRSRTLGVYYPIGERLTGFPSISEESFE